MFKSTAHMFKKNLGVSGCSRIPRNMKQRWVVSGSFLTGQPSPNEKFQISERLVSRQQCRSHQRRISHSGLYVHMYPHGHVYSYTHMYVSNMYTYKISEWLKYICVCYPYGVST